MTRTRIPWGHYTSKLQAAERVRLCQAKGERVEIEARSITGRDVHGAYENRAMWQVWLQ